MSVFWFGSEPHYRLHIAPLAAAVGAEQVTNPTALPAGSWLIVASRRDARTAPHCNIVLIEHGAGQYYAMDAGGAHYIHDNVRLFLAPRQEVADRGASMFPNAERIVATPYLEWLGMLPRIPRHVTFTCHSNTDIAPETRSGWDHFQPGLPALAGQFDLLLHSHPRMRNAVLKRARQLNVPYMPDWSTVAPSTRVLLVDNSSVMWEACWLDIPIVILNPPWYRRDMEWGMRFWDYADTGPNVEHPADMVNTVASVIDDDIWVERRREVADLVYENVPGSTAHATEAVVHLSS